MLFKSIFCALPVTDVGQWNGEESCQVGVEDEQMSQVQCDDEGGTQIQPGVNDQIQKVWNDRKLWISVPISNRFLPSCRRYRCLRPSRFAQQ